MRLGSVSLLVLALVRVFVAALVLLRRNLLAWSGRGLLCGLLVGSQRSQVRNEGASGVSRVQDNGNGHRAVFVLLRLYCLQPGRTETLDDGGGGRGLVLGRLKCPLSLELDLIG
jgi:hypothetical protein